MVGARQAATLGMLVAWAAGCGETEKGARTSAAPPALDCENAPPAGELALLSEDSDQVAMGPCGELSYVAGGAAYLVDASLASPELLEGATAPVHFDPHGRAVFYLADADSTLVYRELRGPVAWSTALPAISKEDSSYDDGDFDTPLRALDFYSRGQKSGLFRCQGNALYDYDQAGQESAHELGVLCPRARYSVLDAILIGPTAEGYRGLKLGDWQLYALPALGNCGADTCELKLARKVIVKDRYIHQPIGDFITALFAGTQYYDAETGAEVAYGLTTPDRGVVEGPGWALYRDDSRTLAVTEEFNGDETSVRYFGPDPMQPSRWLAASFTLPEGRGISKALPSDDLRQIALWSDDCQSERRTLLTFAPGQEPAFLDVAECVTDVNWVGSDGMLLAELRDADYQPHLALIAPDGRVVPLETELVPTTYGVRLAVSDGTSLVIATGYGGPLHLIDLQSGASRELAPNVEQLFTDRAHERLAFTVYASSSAGPNPLWAGAFPH